MDRQDAGLWNAQIKFHHSSFQSGLAIRCPAGFRLRLGGLTGTRTTVVIIEPIGAVAGHFKVSFGHLPV